jgi:hypothetical protein
MTYLYSHCHWSPYHDVANPDEGALREPATALQIRKDVEAHLYLPYTQLDNWTPHHGRYGVGNATGPANLSYRHVFLSLVHKQEF